jgi:hypothetical protein
MTGLDRWLSTATRGLSKNSSAQVRAEIQQHYESVREVALSDGATAYESDQAALKALGNAATANQQYRRVLLTSSEAGMLGEGDRESRAMCPHSLVKWLLAAILVPVALLWAAWALCLCAAAMQANAGEVSIARVEVAGAVMTGLLFVAPFLPVYTRSRSRMFRGMKWVAMMCTLVLAFGPDTLKYFWLLAACMWPFAWMEWMRNSIRRKLPVSRWPRQLYL